MYPFVSDLKSIIQVMFQIIVRIISQLLLICQALQYWLCQWHWPAVYFSLLHWNGSMNLAFIVCQDPWRNPAWHLNILSAAPCSSWKTAPLSKSSRPYLHRILSPSGLSVNYVCIWWYPVSVCMLGFVCESCRNVRGVVYSQHQSSKDLCGQT